MGGIIHVGSWLGLEYLRLRGQKQKLVLFEPQKRVFAELEDSFGEAANVELHRLALGREKGTATMNTSHPDHSSSLLECRELPDERARTITFSGTEEVQVDTLDNVIGRRRGFTDLHIDTQGYELEVLRGAERTLRQIKRIEAEVHDPNTYVGAGSLEDIDDFLTERGFERTMLAEPGKDDMADVVYERRP
jgi:FkbM family methyltransferase